MPSYTAIRFPTFQPALRLISDITNSYPAQITTTFAHQYVTGIIIRLDVPEENGMFQANQLFSDIIVTSSTTFTMNIDTTKFDHFITAGSAQAIPIGEVNSMLSAATRNVLPY